MNYTTSLNLYIDMNLKESDGSYCGYVGELMSRNPQQNNSNMVILGYVNELKFTKLPGMYQWHGLFRKTQRTQVYEPGQ